MWSIDPNLMMMSKYGNTSVFGARFENNLSVGQVAQKIHLSWCCPKLSQILKKSQHLDNYRLAG